MFYSHDLLGKKTALGAVWVVAHGKKLNKGRIMQVNVSEACTKVMDPELPQALRLQAILVGGIVIVHARQQVYLLEDAQETLRRLRMLDGESEAGAAGSRGGGGGSKPVAAREEVITLPLNADMQLLHLGDLFPSFPTQTLSGMTAGRSGEQQQLSDNLFVMPSLPDVSEGMAPSSGGAAVARAKRGKGRKAPSSDSGEDISRPQAAGANGGLLGAGAGQDVEIRLEGLPQYDLAFMDAPETFAVPDIDQLPGLEHLLGFQPATVPQASVPYGELPAALGMDIPPPPEGLEFDAADAAVPNAGQPASSRGTNTSGERNEGFKPSEKFDQVEDGGAAAVAHAGKGRKKRQGVKRRARPTVDDIDTLLIKGREYQEWQADSSHLLVPRGRRPGLQASCAAISPLGGAISKAAPLVAPSCAMPAELRELYLRHAVLPKAEGHALRKKGKGKGDAGLSAAQQDPLVEQEQYLDDMAVAAQPPLAMEDGFAFGSEEIGLGYGHGGTEGLDGLADAAHVAVPGAHGWGNLEGVDGGNPFQQLAGLDRAPSQDSEELDVETERLRAALNSTQGSEPLYLQHLGLTPASPDPARPASGQTTRGRGAKRGSSVLRRGSESGTLSERSSGRREGGRLSDLLEGGAALGGDDLGALLPAVGEEEELLLHEEEEGEEGRAAGTCKRQRLGDRAEGRPALGSLTQFELLEASGPTQEHGWGVADGTRLGAIHLNRQTLAFVGVVRSRLEALDARQAEGGELAGEDEEAPPPQLSLFQLAAKLSRMDAAKLFYQTLQARSHHFLRLHQGEPYTDITLTRDTNL